MGLVAEVLMPGGGGPHPAVVLGAEAYGVNSFIRGVQEKLAGLGYAVALPDYYHGNGPVEPDNYDDFTEVKEHIGRLDFTRGARDLAATVDAVRAMPGVDPRRVAVWGLLHRRDSRLADRVPARRPGGGGALLSEPAGIRGSWADHARAPGRPALAADLPGAFPVRRPGRADAPRRASGPARPHRLLASRRPGQRVSGGGPFIHLPAGTHA